VLNKLIVIFTNFLSQLLTLVKLDKQIRKENDIRSVSYHGIGDKTSPCMKYLNDEIPQPIFEAHLDYLQEKYILLPVQDAVKLVQTGELLKDRPICSISFDDGLRSVYTNAFPILKKRGIRFDVYINTSSIGNVDFLWLHSLNYLLTTHQPEHVAKSINGLINIDIPKAPLDAPGIESWCRRHFEYFHESDLMNQLYKQYGLNLKKIAAEQSLYLNWDQIEEMSAYGVGVYSHTHRHFPLNVFSDDKQIVSEIEVARGIMETHQKTSNYLSFPFGMEIDYGKRALNYALAAGYDIVVEIGNGLNSPERMKHNKIMSRVGLGNAGSSRASLYSAIELRPIIKTKLKSLIKKLIKVSN
jgi:peptidoglycan/xylan/chitin deacetylase (PgdA/CDA1 family)